jgi:hypothetical protein
MTEILFPGLLWAKIVKIKYIFKLFLFIQQFFINYANYCIVNEIVIDKNILENLLHENKSLKNATEKNTVILDFLASKYCFFN